MAGPIEETLFADDLEPPSALRRYDKTVYRDYEPGELQQQQDLLEKGWEPVFDPERKWELYAQKPGYQDWFKQGKNNNAVATELAIAMGLKLPKLKDGQQPDKVGTQIMRRIKDSNLHHDKSLLDAVEYWLDEGDGSAINQSTYRFAVLRGHLRRGYADVDRMAKKNNWSKDEVAKAMRKVTRYGIKRANLLHRKQAALLLETDRDKAARPSLQKLFDQDRINEHLQTDTVGDDTAADFLVGDKHILKRVLDPTEFDRYSGQLAATGQHNAKQKGHLRMLMDIQNESYEMAFGAAGLRALQQARETIKQGKTGLPSADGVQPLKAANLASIREALGLEEVEFKARLDQAHATVMVGEIMDLAEAVKDSPYYEQGVKEMERLVTDADRIVRLTRANALEGELKRVYANEFKAIRGMFGGKDVNIVKDFLGTMSDLAKHEDREALKAIIDQFLKTQDGGFKKAFGRHMVKSGFNMEEVTDESWPVFARIMSGKIKLPGGEEVTVADELGTYLFPVEGHELMDFNVTMAIRALLEDKRMAMHFFRHYDETDDYDSARLKTLAKRAANVAVKSGQHYMQRYLNNLGRTLPGGMIEEGFRLENAAAAIFGYLGTTGDDGLNNHHRHYYPAETIDGGAKYLNLDADWDIEREYAPIGMKPYKEIKVDRNLKHLIRDFEISR